MIIHILLYIKYKIIILFFTIKFLINIKFYKNYYIKNIINLNLILKNLKLINIKNKIKIKKNKMKFDK